jgi:hypothetical protein
MYGVLVVLALAGCATEDGTGDCSGVVAGDACNPTCKYTGCGCSSAGVLECPAVCSDLVLTGSPVQPMIVMEREPSSTGGTIADGTYVLTSATMYGNPGRTLLPMRAVFRISGNKIELIESDGGGSYTQSGTFTTNDADGSMTVTFTCGGNGMPGGAFYSATATTLTISQPASPIAAPILTLTKQ